MNNASFSCVLILDQSNTTVSAQGTYNASSDAWLEFYILQSQNAQILTEHKWSIPKKYLPLQW